MCEYFTTEGAAILAAWEDNCDAARRSQEARGKFLRDIGIGSVEVTPAAARKSHGSCCGNCHGKNETTTDEQPSFAPAEEKPGTVPDFLQPENDLIGFGGDKQPEVIPEVTGYQAVGLVNGGAFLVIGGDATGLVNVARSGKLDSAIAEIKEKAGAREVLVENSHLNRPAQRKLVEAGFRLVPTKV